jgi:hypothetical protein
LALKNETNGCIIKESGLLLFRLNSKIRDVWVKNKFQKGKENFENLGFFTDVIYVPKIDMYVTLDETVMMVIGVETNFKIQENAIRWHPIFMDMKGSSKISRTFKLNEISQELLINYDDTKIYIATFLASFKDSNLFAIDLEPLLSEKLSDFAPFSFDRVATISEDGLLSTFFYDQIEGVSYLASSYRIQGSKHVNNDNEKFISLTVCPQSRYIAVSSSIGKMKRAKDLIIFTLDAAKGIVKEVYRKKFGIGFSFHDERFSLKFVRYINGFPLLASAERIGRGTLYLQFFDGQKLRNFFDKFENMNSEDNFRMEVIGDKIYNIDTRGNLAVLEILNNTKSVKEKKMAEAKFYKKLESKKENERIRLKRQTEELLKSGL